MNVADWLMLMLVAYFVLRAIWWVVKRYATYRWAWLFERRNDSNRGSGGWR